MITLATRKSPLALAQAELVAAHLRSSLREDVRLLHVVTTGDKQTQWSLEKRGGKGLFTTELEQALRSGEADIAVHSTKDLPGEMTDGLVVAGYLPRADARDVLVRRADVSIPSTIATGSPRRRLQLSLVYPSASFTEIRGNVDTRLRKIASDRVADATMLAAAGLSRLGINAWENLVFEPQPFESLVPAVGQAAIAVQCLQSASGRFSPLFDQNTFRSVTLERAFQTALGGGCHTAFAAHADGDRLHLFHENCGRRCLPLSVDDFANPEGTARRVLAELKLLK